ncbi:MAG: HAD family phosphatase [Thermoguttaceae bacterium]|nr:HAD family phosphatase [Thermoguttaceae bacterium]MDW8037356.1 HAD family phosphatase [Thermoguttaceae bacterium]
MTPLTEGKQRAMGLPEPSPLGVIFDMDGVLVDSYWAHLKSWQIVAAQEGRQITEQEFAATFGRTSREIIASWPNACYTDEQIAQLDRRKEAAFRELLAAHFTPMPGVHQMLERLAQAGFRLAVGSSGPPENVAMVLDRLGWKDRFAAVVHGMDISRGKPEPDVFLLAAQRAGLQPANCVVVEDAPVGIEAAHRAGMKAIGLISTGRTAEQLAAADLVVHHLEEITPQQILALLRPLPLSEAGRK